MQRPILFAAASAPVFSTSAPPNRLARTIAMVRDGGILAACKLRDDVGARRARGETVAPKPKLRLGEAADSWLEGPVLDLRGTTQAKYRTIVNEHLRPRFGARQLDAVVADDLARLVGEMRTEGKSEATMAVVLGVVGQVYKFAARRLGWKGTIPTTLMPP
jgi:Phage integrase, N-terminal SAM-like domain